MPYLTIQTNKSIAPESVKPLLSKASQKIADTLGKPERYVMVNLISGARMIFAGSDAPAAYVELKSIGLPDSQTQHLSHILCAFLSETLDIEPERVYIEFNDIPRKLWGWNGSTF